MSKISFRSVYKKDDEKKQQSPKKSDKKRSSKKKSSKKELDKKQVPEKVEVQPEESVEQVPEEEVVTHEPKQEETPPATEPIKEEKPVEVQEEVVPESTPEPEQVPGEEPAPKQETKVMSISSLFKIERRAKEPLVSEVQETSIPETSIESEVTEELEPESLQLDDSVESGETEERGEEYESDQIITFFLGGEQYGLDILDAREVKRILPLTPIPKTPDWVLGVVNLRGIVFPVVDLRKRLRIETEIEYPIAFRRIIIVELEDTTRIGLLVDKIHRIFNKQLLEYSVPPALISGGEDFISSIAKKDENIISIISLKQLFTMEERELLLKIKEEKT